MRSSPLFGTAVAVLLVVGCRGTPAEAQKSPGKEVRVEVAKKDSCCASDVKKDCCCSTPATSAQAGVCCSSGKSPCCETAGAKVKCGCCKADGTCAVCACCGEKCECAGCGDRRKSKP